MATIRVAIDNCYGYSSDTKTLNTFAEKLRQAGHTVTTHGVGPNKIQGVMRKSSNKCDIAIQIAGGKCLGTLCDFYVGVDSGYYHATKMGFAYYKCYKADWPAKREPRDHFSTRPGTRVKTEADKMTGKTLPQIFEIYKDKMVYGYGDNAEDCAKTLLQNMNGGTANTTSNTDTTGGGRTALDVIKEICTDWNPYGLDATITGDTLNIRRTRPNTAIPLTEKMIVNNSVSFTDYDNSTPGSYKGYEDAYVVNRFGNIPVDESLVDSPQKDQILLMAQRGHGHSIDLKVVADPRLVAGQWVALTLPRYNIFGRNYHITKSTYQEERTMSLTLEPGPPQFYTEVQEVVDDTSANDETTTTEET